MLSSIQSNSGNHSQNMVPEKAKNNLRNDGNGQYSNTLPQQDYSAYDPNFEIANRAFYATINKFTRQACSDASSTRRRSPPYSFLENWHLHSIYSKSQQTLLGITPVKPSVLLSGDDFMFTPPFIQEEEEEEEIYSDDEEEEDYIWRTNEFYNLSPCPKSNQIGELFSHSSYPPASTATATPLSYFETAPLSPHSVATTKYFYDQQENQGENIWIENDERRPHNLNGFQSLSNLNLLSIQIPSQDTAVDPPSSPEEESSSFFSSSDEQFSMSCSPSDSECSSITSDKLDIFFNTNQDPSSISEQPQQDLSSYDLVNLYDSASPTLEEQNVAQSPTLNCPVTRSSSFKSQTSIESVVSYQSLADLINQQQPSFSSYGSISNSSTRSLNESNSKKSILNSIVHTFVNNNNNAKDHDALYYEEMGTRPTNERSTALNTIWTSLAIFVLYYWQLLIQFFAARTSSEESESLI
ncbi:hypothetical protein [Parasitella parasitica]|uniref:Uncharacterized protein n=1 Tax=Parasitella parasitica TaxID=35722 RepID=A0A0B7NVT8_9FUNG|nr:hypothetical protein [Parasitella parasitica]